MSQVEVLTARAAVNFDRLSSNNLDFSRIHEDNHNNLTPISDTPNHTTFHHNHDDDVHIENLPPLLRGHPDVHLRNGVMRAARLAAVQEVDSEKAFFVADLSSVYMQHLRWKKCLPEIEPFYGRYYYSECIHAGLTTISREVQPGPLRTPPPSCSWGWFRLCLHWRNKSSPSYGQR